MSRSAPRTSTLAGHKSFTGPTIATDIVVLSFCDDDLARFKSAWCEGSSPAVQTISIAAVTSRRHVDQVIAGARAILVTLPAPIADRREVIETIATIACAGKVPFAVITTHDPAEVPNERLGNLPHSTLRRLNKLYRQPSRSAARNVLTQFALAAGLTIPIACNVVPSEPSLQHGSEAGNPKPHELVEDAA